MQPTASVAFATGGTAVHIADLRIVHDEFEHEMAVLSLPRATADTKRFTSGAPLTITYGHAPQALATFTGYVSHIDPGYSLEGQRKSEERGVRVYALAPSYAFKEGGYAVTKQASVSTHVKNFAEVARFTQKIALHPTLWPSLAQAGRSEWEFMAALARKVGWTLFARGTTLYFNGRFQVLAETASQPVLLIPRGITGNMLEFDSSIGQVAPAGGVLARREIHGVDDRSGRSFALAGTNLGRPMLGRTRPAPVFTRGLMETAGSLGDASARLDAAEGENEMSTVGSAVIHGNARAKVGATARVLGVDALNDGFWYITGVTHELTRPHSYVTRLRLGRDAPAGGGVPPAPTTAERTPMSSRLVNERWVTA